MRLEYRERCSLLFFWTLCSLIVLAEKASVTINADGQVSLEETISSYDVYGVDSSWPMQHVSSESTEMHRRNEYERYIIGCLEQDIHHSKALSSSCRQYEQDRIDMNLNQPKTMENYTHAGFAKLQTPIKVQNLLRGFWESNNYGKDSQQEHWDAFNTYVNHWQAPTAMLDILDDTHNTEHPLSHQERLELVKEIQSILEAWTKQPLVLTSLYGIRIYNQGAVLAPHVDRLPLVSSAIINVDQDIDEPWPLEVIGHDGIAHNITMEPGEMILYESHSVIHGRPYPLKGSFYANLFVHFEPLGHTLRHTQNMKENLSDSAKLAYEKAFQNSKVKSNKEKETGKSAAKVPHYVPLEKEERWKQQFDFEMDVKVPLKPLQLVLISVTPHNAAATGNLDALVTLAEQDRSNLFKRDQNGWRPLRKFAFEYDYFL